jgi:ribonuclease J
MVDAKGSRTKITFHGGVGEIGGNKFLVEDLDTRIFLDFGMGFSERRKFYLEPWLSPRDEKGLLEFGMLPQIEGVYKFDNRPRTVDAIFLSHSHADHSAYVSFLKRDIPVYCGETTQIILKALNETRPKRFETDISNIQFRPFRTGQRIRVGSLEIEPYHVDHSVPGAYGFIIHTSAGGIAYTGDIRVHGRKSEMTEDFVQAARRSKPLVLLSEGTNILGASVLGETEVETKLDYVVSATEELVMADFSYSDIDRLNTFRKVAERNGRLLAISMKQAHTLNQLRKDRKLRVPDVFNDNIIIYRKSKKRFYDWEEDILNRGNVKDASQVKSSQDKTILVSSFSDMKELIDIRPKFGSNFIHSSSEPYNEEQAIEFDKLTNWLDHFGLPLYHIHCSGHMMPNDMKKIARTIAPQKLFPIHTEYPELVGKFLHTVTEIEIPLRGGTFTL